MYILIQPKLGITIDDDELMHVIKLSITTFKIIRTWCCDSLHTFYTLQVHINTNSHELLSRIISTIEMRFAHLTLDCKIVDNEK